MKKILPILTLIVVLSGCQQEMAPVDCLTCDAPFQLESTYVLNNEKLLEQTYKLIESSNIPVLKNAVLENVEITISSYVNTDVKAIIVPLSSTSLSEETFVTYTLEEEVLNDFLVLKFEQIDANIQTTSFFNSNNELLGSISVKDNVLINSYVNSDLKSTSSFLSKWNECVKAAIDRMSSGTTWGNVEFLACVTFGPSCAAGTAIGCAGVALTK